MTKKLKFIDREDVRKEFNRRRQYYWQPTYEDTLNHSNEGKIGSCMTLRRIEKYLRNER